MQKIPLAQAAPGMVLARDIMNNDNPSSMPICGKGVKLSESLIDRLKQMGVQSITVEGRPIMVAGEATAEELLEALDRRFMLVDKDPLMMRVKELYRRQILKAMGGSNGG